MRTSWSWPKTWPHGGWWRCSLLQRFRSAALLRGEEFWLALRAIGWLVVARVSLAALGFPRVRRALDSQVPGRRRGVEYAVDVRRAVSRAARTVPGSACLPQAIVAYGLLRAGGLPAELMIGVRRGSDRALGPLDAHAWVRSGGLLVAGDADDTDVGDFTELARFRSGA